MSKKDYEQLLEQTLQSISKSPKGTLFSVKDTFEGTIWNALEKGDKVGYGRFFKNQVNTGKVKGVKYIGKAANNSAQYLINKED